MSGPNPQDPNSPLYTIIDTQPEDEPPCNPDSSLSHFTTRQIIPTEITAAKPPIVTSEGHGLTAGDAVRATKFIYYPLASSSGMQPLNNNLFYVQQVTTDTFALYDKDGLPVDASSYPPYISGGLFTFVGPYLCVNPTDFPPLGVPPFPPE